MGAAEEKLAVARLSVYSNSALVVLKLVSGLVMGSVAVMSEAIHSALDLLAALIARYSVKKSSEPADRDHTFGHGKYENLSGMIEGGLIFLAAAGIMYYAASRLLGDEVEVEVLEFGMVIMGLSAAVNYYVSMRLMKVAKQTDSLALEADAYHLRTDVWTSVGVFVSIVFIWVTGVHLIDPIVAIIVAGFIIHAAYDITSRSTGGLLDRSLPEEEMRLIERIIEEHRSDILSFHKLRARKMGADRQVDVHMIVPRNLSVKEGHDLVDHMEREIRKELPKCVVVIHMEPCNAECEKCSMSPPPEPLVSVPPEGSRSECRPKK